MFACRFFFKMLIYAKSLVSQLLKKKKASTYSLSKSLKALICKNHISISMAN